MSEIDIKRNPDILDAKMIRQNGGFKTFIAWYSNSPNARAKSIQGLTGTEYEVLYTDVNVPPDVMIAVSDHEIRVKEGILKD